MPRRSKEWYSKKIKVLRRVNDDDKALKKRIEKSIQRNSKKINQLMRKMK